MIRFPHAKINLGLSVVSRRPDGFHDIETIFYPIPLYDVVEMLPDSVTTLSITGLPVPGILGDNLLIRAWQMLKKKFPSIPPIHIILHKAIPMGAGLGGGSSDAAQLLLMMDAYFDLGLGLAGLNDLAAGLGSDCAFFLQNGPCLGTGKGERLEPVGLDLSGYDLLLVHPSVSVPTAWAYSQIRPAPPAVSLQTLITQKPEHWKGAMNNDFEAPVFAAHPELAAVKTELYALGAKYAAMTGSGSTFFGIFSAGTCPEKAMTGKYTTRLLKASQDDRLW